MEVLEQPSQSKDLNQMEKLWCDLHDRKQPKKTSLDAELQLFLNAQVPLKCRKRHLANQLALFGVFQPVDQQCAAADPLFRNLWSFPNFPWFLLKMI